MEVAGPARCGPRVDARGRARARAVRPYAPGALRRRDPRRENRHSIGVVVRGTPQRQGKVVHMVKRVEDMSAELTGITTVSRDLH